MAISIVTTPQAYSPVYSEIGFSVSSTNVNECNFRFIAQIYVEGVLVTDLKQFPDPETGLGLFKINRILEDYVSYDLQQNLYGFATNPNSICKYYVVFGESYDSSSDCSAGPTDHTGLATSSTYFAWNGCLQYEEYPSYDYTDFIPAPSTEARFLTNIPSGKIFIGFGDQMWINFLQASQVTTVKLETFDLEGVSSGTYSFTNTVTYVSGTSATHLISFGCGPENINNHSQFTTFVPIQQDISSYTIWLYDTNTSQDMSERINFKLDARCSKFDPTRVIFQNRLGGFDGYTFTMRNVETQASQRMEWQKLLGRLDSDGSPYRFPTYNIGDRGRTVSAINTNSKRNILSNWMTEDEVAWLAELFSSPQVYRMETNPILRSYDTYFSASNLGLLFNAKHNTATLDVSHNVRIDKDDKSINPNYDGIKVISGSIPDDYHLVVVEAFGSSSTLEGSNVFKHDATLNLFPVMVTDAEYQLQKKGDMALLQVTLNIDDAYRKQVQRS